MTLTYPDIFGLTQSRPRSRPEIKAMKLHLICSDSYFRCENGEEIIDLIDVSHHPHGIMKDGSWLVDYTQRAEYKSPVKISGDSSIVRYVSQPITEEIARSIDFRSYAVLLPFLGYDAIWDPSVKYPCELMYELGLDSYERMWMTDAHLCVRSSKVEHAEDYSNPESTFHSLTVELEHTDHLEEFVRFIRTLFTEDCSHLTIVCHESVNSFAASRYAHKVLKRFRHCVMTDIVLKGSFRMSKQLAGRLYGLT